MTSATWCFPRRRPYSTVRFLFFPSQPWQTQRMPKYTFYELHREEIAELDRPIRGVGGFQSLMKRLQKQLNHGTGTIHLTADDLEDIRRSAFEYAEGGFEDRLVAIFGRVLGPKLGREE